MRYRNLIDFAKKVDLEDYLEKFGEFLTKIIILLF